MAGDQAGRALPEAVLAGCPSTTCPPSEEIGCSTSSGREASFAPRIAAAYDPAGDGRTSIHAAHGRYDDYQILASVVTGQIVNGSSGVRTLALRLPASIAAWNAPGHRLPEPAAAFPSVEISMTPDLKVPYAMHTARRRRSRDRAATVVAANFIHVRGRHQLGTIDYNPIVPSLGPGRQAQRRRWPRRHVGVGSSVHVVRRQLVPRPDDLAEQAVQRTASAPRLVHALEGRGLRPRTFRARSCPRTTAPAETPRIPPACRVGFDPARERGPATHDQRHRLVVSGLYQFPFGFQVASIVTAASGRPFTPLAGADLNGDGDGGAFPTDRARRDPADAGSSVGRNSETMPAQVTVDVRVSKRFTVRGRARRWKSSPRPSICSTARTSAR